MKLQQAWKDGSQQRNVSASQMIVILPEMVGKAGQLPQQGTAVQPQGTPPLPGQPVRLPGQP